MCKVIKGINESIENPVFLVLHGTRLVQGDDVLPYFRRGFSLLAKDSSVDKRNEERLKKKKKVE